MRFEGRTLTTGAVVAMLSAHRRDWVRSHDESIEVRGDHLRRRVEMAFELPAIAWAAVPRGEAVVVPVGLRAKGIDSRVDARHEDGVVAVLPRAWADEVAAAGLLALAGGAGARADDRGLVRLVRQLVEGSGDEARAALDELAVGGSDGARRAWMHGPFRDAARGLMDQRMLLVALPDGDRPRVVTYAYDEPLEARHRAATGGIYGRLARLLGWDGLRAVVALPHLGDARSHSVTADAGASRAELDVDERGRTAELSVSAPATLALRLGPVAGLLAALMLTAGWVAAPSLSGGSSPLLLALVVPVVLAAYLARRPEPGEPPGLGRGVRVLLALVVLLSLAAEALLGSGASTAVLRAGGGVLLLAAWAVAVLLLETRRRGLGGAPPRPVPAAVRRAGPDAGGPGGDDRRVDPLRTALLGLAMGVGLMIVAGADDMARDGHSGAQTVLWCGLLAIFVPAVVHAWRAPPRAEAVLAVVMLGAALYLVKVLHSPLYFTFHDEFSTLRTTVDIERFGRLFEPNPLIEVHPVYPGLELATSALSSLTGLSTFAAGLVVIGVLRIALMAALFLIFEAVASTRVAALATVLYACNPNFLLFDSQWAYESFALPLALVIVALAAQGRRGTWFAVPLVLALCVSHPLTSVALVAFLVVWAGLEAWRARRSGGPARSELWILAATGAAAFALWAAFVAREVGGYLGPVLGDAGNSFVDLLLGQSGPKRLFGAAGVSDTPIGERLLGYAAVLLALAAVAFGVRLVWRRFTPLAAALALTGLVYPLTLPLRLIESGTEISNRASEFVFVGVALLGALALVEHARARRFATHAVVAAAAVALVGGVIVGTAPFSRLPGDYEVVADESSVEPEGRDAASWALDGLGRGNRIVTDRINALLMGSIGLQEPQLGEAGGRPLTQLLTDPALDADARYVVSADRIGYLVADKRITTGKPAVGFYFTREEPGAYRHKRPIDLRALVKWDLVCPVGRSFDSGNIVVYDTRRMSVRGECPNAGPGSPEGRP